MSKSEPGHVTAAGTQKHQANGPTSWARVFAKVAGRGGRVGEGVRAALAYAVAHEAAFIAWAESHPGQWAPASTRPESVTRQKAPVKANGKGPKVKAKRPKVKAKGPKVKAASAPRGESEQLSHAAVA